MHTALITTAVIVGIFRLVIWWAAGKPSREQKAVDKFRLKQNLANKRVTKGVPFSDRIPPK